MQAARGEVFVIHLTAQKVVHRGHFPRHQHVAGAAHRAALAPDVAPRPVAEEHLLVIRLIQAVNGAAEPGIIIRAAETIDKMTVENQRKLGQQRRPRRLIERYIVDQTNGVTDLLRFHIGAHMLVHQYELTDRNR